MINKVILVGRLGKDAIVRKTANGSSVANFSVATSESRKDEKGEWVEKTEWHNCQFWGNGSKEPNERVNNFANSAKKGLMVYVEGKKQTRSYEQEGQTKYITEIVAGIVRVLDKNSTPEGEIARQDSQGSQNNQAQPAADLATEIDDLPF